MKSVLRKNDSPLKKRTSTFKGDVLRLASGTGIAQLIALLAAPLITRLYSPEDFGVAALFVSFTAVLSVLACMRYEMSIILPEQDREAANLFALSIAFAVLIAALASLFVALAGASVLSWMRIPEFAPYLWLIPLIVLMNGVTTALSYWNTRTRRFTFVSISRVTSSLANISTSLGVGIAGHASGGALIVASIGGQAVATSVLGGQIWRDNGRFIVNSLTWREMWAGLKRYHRFPLFSSWAALLNTASWQLPVLLLGMFFSPAVAGFYALGFRLIQMPMNLVGAAIGQVFFQRGASAKNDGQLGRLVETLFERLLILGLLPTLLLMLFGRDLFSLVFGEGWAEAGVYAQILAPWALLWFISSPFGSVYMILEKQKEELGMQSLIFVARLIALTLGGLSGNPRLAILLLMLGGLLSYGHFFYRVLSYSRLSVRMLIKKNAEHFIRAGGLIFLIMTGYHYFDFSIIEGLAVAGFGLFLYFYSYRNTFSIIFRASA